MVLGHIPPTCFPSIAGTRDIHARQLEKGLDFTVRSKGFFFNRILLERQVVVSIDFTNFLSIASLFNHFGIQSRFFSNFFLRVDLSHPSPSFRKSRSFSLETESRVPGSRRYTRRRGFIVTSSKVVPWVRLFLNGRRGRIRLRLRPLRFRLRESSSIKNFTEPSRF